MRNGLTYTQASANSDRKARLAYEATLAKGKTVPEAQDAAFVAYEAEMQWYEGK